MSKSSFAKLTLDYPLYAAAPHPYKPYVLVGGGGGENASGVKNKLTLLDISARNEIKQVSELAVGPDSANSLGALAAKDGLIAFAGINSSNADREIGKNEHLHTYEFPLPPEKTPELLSKTSLFAAKPSKTTNFDTYQRTLRLSSTHRPGPANKRIGAVATGLGDSELVLFNATTSRPNDVIQRITPSGEVSDVDILEVTPGVYRTIFATERDVFLCSDINYDFHKKKPRSKLIKPHQVYSYPFPDAFSAPQRPKLRAIRFLTTHHVLILSNLPNKSGAELLILRIWEEGGPGDILLRKKLPRHVKQAVGLDVCPLDADPFTGARQIAVAVAGQDVSIIVLTIDVTFPKPTSEKEKKKKQSPPVGHLSKWRVHADYNDVHPLQMTKLVFLPFHSPWLTAPSSANEKPKTPPPQYLRLLSTSLGNTVVVDTFPLQPLEPSKPKSRYVLSHPSTALSDKLNQGLGLFVAAFVLLVGLLLFQSFIDARAAPGQPRIQLFPQRVQDVLSQVNARLKPPGARLDTPVIPDLDPMAEPIKQTKHKLRDLLHLHRHPATPKSEKKAVVIRPGIPVDGNAAVSTEIHDSVEAVKEHDESVKTWDQLGERGRGRWKERLMEAGEWVEGEMESVLKGVLFSEYAGLVGGLVR